MQQFQWIVQLVICVCMLVVAVRGECADINTQACVLLQDEKPELCADPALAPTACPHFCGLCLECFQCNSTLENFCNVSQTCEVGEVCMITQVADATLFQLSCGAQEDCDGDAVSCCNDGLCNVPVAPTPKPPCVFDLIFVLEETDAQADQERNVVYYMQDIVALLDIGNDTVLTSVVTFAETASERIDFDDYTTKEDLMYALRDLTFQGGASADVNVGLGYVANFSLTDTAGDRPSVPNVVIVISRDGIIYVDEVLLKTITDMTSMLVVLDIGQESVGIQGLDGALVSHLLPKYVLGGSVMTVMNMICP